MDTIENGQAALCTYYHVLTQTGVTDGQIKSKLKESTLEIAGLRQLGIEVSERILQSAKDLLKDKSSFKSDNNWVTVLNGTQEGFAAGSNDGRVILKHFNPSNQNNDE
ncbi:hypothetical protein L2E82_36091 [Cichorium intybus]|uniref:Uncharacterized protein n=1 Tax=Cichorium intybus TaxID=13427 RepID=A0ACB9BQR1_CICIN|nr:hypothetical protein L2E82_36091 [Cichorium intybus]